jgi:hypothetical protein
MDPAREIVDIADVSEFVLSMIVGRRERIPLDELSSAPEYMLIVLPPWDRPRSFISFKYAITERKARVYASRTRSSSLRVAKSTLSESGTGLDVILGPGSSVLSPPDRRSRKGTGDSAGIVAVSSTGKKLLLLDDRGTGEDDGIRKLPGTAGGGIGEAFSEVGVSFSFSLSSSGGDKATEGAPPVSGPKNSVVEKRRSI